MGPFSCPGRAEACSGSQKGGVWRGAPWGGGDGTLPSSSAVPSLGALNFSLSVIAPQAPSGQGIPPADHKQLLRQDKARCGSF